MATRISPPQNKTYYINPAYLTFVENSGYGANLIQVSASSSCYISVYDPANGIGYSDADRNYQRWKVTAYNNKFPSNEKFYIYVRLERSGTSALVIYDTVLRGVKGGEITVSKDENGNDVYTETESTQDTYWYIRIGEAGETDGASIREVTYDTGYLTSDEGRDTAELNEIWELDKHTTPWLIKAKHWLSSFTVKGFVNLIGGLTFSKGKEGDGKPVTDIKRSVDSDNEYLQNEDGSFIVDEEGNLVKNPLYVPISDESLPSTKYLQDKLDSMDGKYLRKDVSDETPYDLSVGGKLTAKSELQIGDTFVTGLTGTGGRIDKDGHGELTSLSLREFLEVPELRFNRVDVVSGELWNAVAFGLIESVDTEQRICTLKLEPNERAGLAEDDICRGIFADFGEEERYEEVDECNFLHLYGFKTSYFSVVSILEDSEGVCRFVYSLRNESTPHPCPFMKFAVYGNFWDTSRQASAYSTRTYKRYLNKVDQYVINPDKHIYAQYGDLSGLSISGFEMSGYGSYQSNSYLKGGQFQLSDQQKDELKGDDAYSVMLSDYVGVVRMDSDGNIVAGEYMPLNVVAGEENVTTGGENVVTGDYILQTRIQAAKGRMLLTYSDGATEGTYIAAISPVGCTAQLSSGVISITGITDTEYCYVGIEVSCEGNSSFTMTYQIKVVKDGASAIIADMDNEMDSVACTSDGKVLFGLPATTRVTMWSGTRQIPIDEVSVSAPNGVTASSSVSDDGMTSVISVNGIPDGDAETLIIPVNITVYGVIDGFRYPKNLVFTLNKVMQGEAAVILEVNPSVGAIKLSQNGNYYPSTVYCSLLRTEGANVSEELDALPGYGYSMKYSLDDGEWKTYNCSSAVDVEGVMSSVSFRLFYGNDLLDTETIPVLKDGEKGEKGDKGDVGDKGVSPVVYRILSDVMTVKVDAEGKYSTTSVHPSIVKTEGGDAVVMHELPVGYGLLYEKDYSGEWISVDFSNGINIEDTEEMLSLELQKGSEVFDKLMIPVVKDGTVGEITTVYSINPSVNVVKKMASGILSPETINAYVMLRAGSYIDVLEELPEGYSMELWIDGQKNGSYRYGGAIDIPLDAKDLEYILYHDSMVIDKESIPVLVEGQDGENALVADLSNDMIAVECDENGQPVEIYSTTNYLSTTFRAYYGLEELGLQSLTATSHEGMNITCLKKDGSVKIISFRKEAAETTEVTVTGTVLVNGETKTLSKMFTVTKVKKGEAGITPVIYHILSDVMTVKVDAEGNYSTDVVNLSILRTEGEQIVELKENPYGYLLTFSKDYSDSWTDASFADGVTVTDVSEILSLQLKKEDTVVDRLMIPVVKDGAAGEITSIYSINPSANVIMKSESGAFSPEEINASIMHRAGTYVDVLEELPDGYSMELWANGIRQTQYEYGKSFVVPEECVQLEYRLYAAGKMVDKEIIPVLTEGQNGENALLADLSNDMIAVECDENGDPVQSYSETNYLSTTLRVYNGQEEIALSGLSSTSHKGMTIKYEVGKGLVKIVSFTSLAADATEITITGVVGVDGEQKSLTKVFSVVKVKKGDTGEPGKNGTYVEDIYMAADTKPAKPSTTTSIPDGWSTDIPDIFTAIGYTTSNAGWEELGSYRKSSAVAVNESTYDQVTFNFTTPTWIVVELAARSFSFNYGYIGALDVAAASVETASSNYLARVSGTNKVTKSVLVPAGRHFLVIKYVKGYSSTANGDYIQYRISAPNQVWQSRAQATWDGSQWLYGEWSEPKIYVAGSGDEELYMLAVTNEVPAAPDSPQFDNYLPVYPYFKEGLFYSAGDKVSYLGKSYECVKGTSTVTPGNTTYWKEIQYWSIVPMDVSEEYPYQYWTRRKKEYGVWSEWSAPTILSMWASGTQGKNGLNGCVTRTWEKYEANRTYRNDTDVEDSSMLENPADGIRYIDVVVLEDSGMESGYMAYQCLKQVSGENPSEQDYSNSVSASGNWRMLDNNAGLYVTTLIARNANIKFGSSFQMTVYDDANNVVGGMKGVSKDADTGIWYGDSLPGDAPFRVEKSGNMYASQAVITGEVNADKGRIGDWSIADGNITQDVTGGLTGVMDDYSISVNAQGVSVDYAEGSISSALGVNYVQVSDWGGFSAVSVQNQIAPGYVNHHKMLGLHVKGYSSDLGLLVDGPGINVSPTDGALSKIGGLSVNARVISTTGTLKTNDDFVVVVGGTVFLPSPSTAPGKVYYIKKMNGTLSVPKCISSDASGSSVGNGSTRTDWGNRSYILVSTGSVWVEFYCSS